MRSLIGCYDESQIFPRALCVRVRGFDLALQRYPLLRGVCLDIVITKGIE